MGYLSENDRDLERLLHYLEHSIPEEEDLVEEAVVDDMASDEDPSKLRGSPSEAVPPTILVAQEA